MMEAKQQQHATKLLHGLRVKAHKEGVTMENAVDFIRDNDFVLLTDCIGCYLQHIDSPHREYLDLGHVSDAYAAMNFLGLGDRILRVETELLEADEAA